ncbi:hypothetical protein CVT26_015563 [Gymnopilus dilepis]|uniref:Uncharacterized protein n=1 Tax=Gymnopilus dilepis TaxID=231916 RepID=A0A409YD77_9AGAR|nr:hypothetical protein CVT26_015563 [Gymnopilus dilepis]
MVLRAEIPFGPTLVLLTEIGFYNTPAGHYRVPSRSHHPCSYMHETAASHIYGGSLDKHTRYELRQHFGPLNVFA